MLSRRRSKRIWRMTIRGMPSGSQQRLRESMRPRATPARRIGAKNGTHSVLPGTPVDPTSALSGDPGMRCSPEDCCGRGHFVTLSKDSLIRRCSAAATSAGLPEEDSADAVTAGLSCAHSR
jgi:hypothetical protein